jgi:tRNA dimethylallyltransferase
MDIGTAKPTASERKLVAHHLIDVANPDETWSVATYRAAALEVIDQIHTENRLPILVGGTGQYITAILEGWNPPPRSKDDSIRKELREFAEKHGAQELHEQLKSLDPSSAERIQPTNLRRVIRALEIIRITGSPVSSSQANDPPRYHILRVGLLRSRAELYERIEIRIEKMFADGFMEEVRHLLAQGYHPDLPSMSAIGYKQVAQVLLGEGSIDSAKAEMLRLTKQFVRRQANWFKRDDPKIHWFDMNEDVLKQVSALVEHILLGEADG